MRTASRGSILDRYRGPLLAVAVVAGIALIGGFVFYSATQTAYACSNEFVPEPTPTPAEGASPQPGFVQPDMGNRHVPIGSKVTYTYCPPASGSHYNTSGAGPITSRVYSVTDTVIPQGWVHNLEHGAIVILYRGDDGAPGGTPEGQAAMRDFFDEFPPSPVCAFEPGGQSPGPVFARFDDMPTPYTAMVWDRVLPLETLDTAAILELYATYAERTNPEKLCEVPDPDAAPNADPGASASPEAS